MIHIAAVLVGIIVLVLIMNIINKPEILVVIIAALCILGVAYILGGSIVGVF